MKRALEIDMTTIDDIFHGSTERITTIEQDGLFGGVFASGNKLAALSHGDVLHRITSPKHLTDFELNYSIEGAYEAALEIAGGDETLADIIMTPGCESKADDSDASWDTQRLRGALAAKLGYTSIDMLDEHGMTYLCLPGCTIEVVEDD